MLDKGNNCAKAPLWFPVMITKKHKHILHSLLLFWAAGIRSPTKHVGFNLQDTQWLEFRRGWSRYHSFPYIRYLMSFSECKEVSERVNNSGLAKVSASACLICGKWQHSPVGNPCSLFMTASAVLTAVDWDLPLLFSWWGQVTAAALLQQ